MGTQSPILGLRSKLPYGGPSRAGAGQSEDHPGAVVKHESEALLAGLASVHRIGVLKVVCKLQGEAAKLAVWLALCNDAPEMVHHLASVS